MTTRLNLWLLLILLVIGLPYYWLLIDDQPGEVAARPLTIGQLRKAATELPGEAPRTIRFESAAARRNPRIILAAGQGLTPTSVEMRSYSLQYPLQAPILIEGGITLVEAAGFRFERFEKEALRRIAEMRRKARLIITLGAELPQGRVLSAPVFPPRRVRDAASCNRPRALAPGLVEIPICDDVIARRMLYVRLADGREYLLAGEIAPTLVSVTAQAGPSRLLNDFYVKQDRKAIHSWLRTIERIMQQAPKLTVIPGHDLLRYDQMRRGFAEH
ncbi:MAG: hypothetical protein N2423_09490 [Novosphingobium sp.]|nr:hypothetical protein [Novosphingobium sp.]